MAKLPSLPKSGASNPEATALLAGRLLAHAKFHLSQWLLLDDGELNAMLENSRLLTAGQHLQQASRAIENVRWLFPDLMVASNDQAQQKVKTVYERIRCLPEDDKAREFGEQCQAEWEASESDGSKSNSAEDIWLTYVRTLLDPLLDEIASAAVSHQDSLQRWLELGRLIEQGICREDVASLVGSANHPPLLVADAYWSWWFDNLPRQPSIEVPADPNQEDSSGFSFAKTGSRQPGELLPENFWEHEVRDAFLEAGWKLEGDLDSLLAKLEELTTEIVTLREESQAQRPRNQKTESATSLPSQLLKIVDGVAHLAAQAAQATGRRVWVDHERTAIWVDGASYQETPPILRLFELLEDHIGKENPANLADLLKNDPDYPQKNKRWSEIGSMVLKPEVKAMIKSAQGKGTWRIA